MKKQEFTLQYPWDDTFTKTGYKPQVNFTLGQNEIGFTMDITVFEQNPKREKTEHLQYVHEDSCVEWFVNFMPEKNDKYFNFEVNANGVMNVACRKNRHEKQLLSIEDIESLNIRTEIHENHWNLSFTVPFALIQKYIPAYVFTPGMKIRTNFYKCGDKTEFPHYGIWNTMPLEKPDFHRPEYFGEVTLT